MPTVPPNLPHVASSGSVNADLGPTPRATPASTQAINTPVAGLPGSAGDLEHALTANLFRALRRPLPVNARNTLASMLQPQPQAAPAVGAARRRPLFELALDVACGLVALGATRVVGWPILVSSLICSSILALFELIARHAGIRRNEVHVTGPHDDAAPAVSPAIQLRINALLAPALRESLAAFEACVDIMQSGRYTALPPLPRVEQAERFSRSTHRWVAELRQDCEKETHVLQALCRTYQALLDDPPEHLEPMREQDYLQSLNTTMFIHNHGAAYLWALNLMLRGRRLQG